MTMTTSPPIDFLADTTLALAPSNPTVASFDSYVTHVRDTVDPSIYLGFLCWYSVPGKCESTFEEFKQLIEDTGAPIHLARPPKPTNVFRRGCTTAQKNHRKVATAIPDSFYNYTIRETGSDDQKLYRKMVREEIDQEGHTLDFVELGDVTFIRETGRIKHQATLQGASDPMFNEIVNEVREFVRENAFTVTAYQIREGIRHALEGGKVRAVRVNPNGGVYFVNATKAETLSQIEHLCSKLEGVTFELPPLLDDGKQRELLRTAFQEESVGALQELSAQALEIAENDGTITEDKWIKMRLDYEDQRDRVREYKALLNDALGESQASLEICEQQILNLRKKVA